MKKLLPDDSAISAIFLTALLTTVNVFAQAQSCGCDHVIEPPLLPTTSVFVDGEELGVKPGETICLSAGFFRQLRLIRISGKPGNPVTIKNCGGMVQVGDTTNYGRWYALDIVSSNYIRVTGSGDSTHHYGIRLAKSGDSGLKIGLSTDTEIDHLEIGDTGFAGIMAKTDYGGSPPPDAPEMNNVNIHDNYVHDTRGEGMYIGETKTPGMNFRHLEVWNNIVTRTGLDFFQVANVVEDVQVHHNVFYKSGTRNVLYQNKGLQIGDNSVGRYYNNFIIGSPSNFMIIMGSGNIDISSNYMSGSAADPGFFIDNRSVTLPGTSIDIRKNFIMEMNEASPFFKIYNELNQLNITENKLEGNNVVLSLGSGAGPNVMQLANSNDVIERVQFTDIEKDNFALAEGSPYAGLGLQQDVTNRNSRPFVALIPDQELEIETSLEIPVLATDPDGDAIILEAFDLPSFVTFKDNGNGNGMFILSPQANDVGVFYKVRVRVTDSHGDMNTEYFSIRVLDPYAFIATASSSLTNFSPENTLDGNMSTRWAPAEDTLHWIKYDLIEDKLVTHVKIAFFEGISTVYPFDIEVSEDDVHWSVVYSGSSTGSTAESETFTFDEVRARYLRIVDRKDSANSYHEVVIHCTTAPVLHTFVSADDVYLEGKKAYDNNFLMVKHPIKESYIRFSVIGLEVNQSPVISARLKLTSMTSGTGSLKVYLGDQRDWTESNILRTDLPSPVHILDTLTTVFISGLTYELNVLAAIPDNGAYTFILTWEGAGGGLSFSSAEGGFQPALNIETLRGAPALASVAMASNLRLSVAEPVLSEPETSLTKINLYPNPVTDKLTVDLGSESSTHVTVEICDQVGRTFIQKGWTAGNQLIDLDLNELNMGPGLYLLKVKQEGASPKIMRLLKE